MISDKTVRVTYRSNNGGSETIDIVITGQQISQTVQRRMNTLMPTVKITDMTELNDEAVQLDHTKTVKAK